MKRVISVLLSIILLVSIGSVSVTAYASEGGSDLDIRQLKYSAPTLSSIPLSKQREYNGTIYYGDGKELYCKVRDAIDKRSTNFKVNYYNTLSFMNSRIMESRVMNMLQNAWSDELSVTSTDGDYVHWSISGADFEYKSPKTNYYQVTIKLTYYSTSDQEKLVDQEVNKIVTAIRKKAWSDYDILKYVHDEICDRTTYDYAAVTSPKRHLYAYSAYGALVGGKCVCQGYATAFYRICRELGYDVRLVYSEPYYGDHAWNIVILDGKSYYVDCTWDDQILDDDRFDTDPDIMGNNYFYFLADYDTLRSLDGGGTYDRAHLIDPELDSDDYFMEKYLDIQADYMYDPSDINAFSTCSESISYSSTVYNTAKKKPTVTVKDINGELLANGKDYTVSYSSNTNCGRAVVKITGLGKYSGMSSSRTFVIKPSAMSKPSLATSGRTSSSLDIMWQNPGGSVSGYQLQRYVDGEWKSVGITTSQKTLSYMAKDLSAGKKYQFRVRAYKNIGRVRYYGEPSPVYTTYTSPKTPSNFAVATKTRTITAKWSKTTCTGYEIQYSTTSDMTGAKTVKASSTATSKVIKSLKKGKKYYVRIRSYKIATVNGKSYTYYSKWSSKKSITVK